MNKFLHLDENISQNEAAVDQFSSMHADSMRRHLLSLNSILDVGLETWCKKTAL